MLNGQVTIGPKITFISLLLVSVAACGVRQNPAESDLPVDAEAQLENPVTQRTARLFQRSCALCHVDGNAGAPRIGHAQEWRERLAEGDDILLQHTIEGLNDMPPLGYCMACEEQDFVALIDFLTGQAGGGTR